MVTWNIHNYHLRFGRMMFVWIFHKVIYNFNKLTSDNFVASAGKNKQTNSLTTIL